MLTIEQLTDQMLKQNREIAELGASTKSAHKRIDENDRITEGIYKLAANVEALAIQVKMLTERFDATVEQMKSDAKARDERTEASIKSQGERIGALEKEPGNKWKALAAQITSLIVAALAGGLISRFGG